MTASTPERSDEIQSPSEDRLVPVQDPSREPVAAQERAGDPGRVLGLVGLVLAFVTSVPGVVISAIALRRSRRAGYRNAPALVGVVVGTVVTLTGIFAGAVLAASLYAQAERCGQLGPGVHDVNGVTVTCR